MSSMEGTDASAIGARDDLLREGVELRDLVFSAGTPAAFARELQAQVRAHGEPIESRLEGTRVQFSTPQPRVAPGQVVALYDGDVLLGGGIAT